MKPIKVRIETEVKLSRVFGGLLLSILGMITYWTGVLVPLKTKTIAVSGFFIGAIVVLLCLYSFSLIEDK